jgi:hypothetical protein
VFLDTTYSPPTRGKLIAVNAGGDLQAALPASQPGDVIELQAGATFTAPKPRRRESSSLQPGQPRKDDAHRAVRRSPAWPAQWNVHLYVLEKHAISQELAAKLMAWRHPGFSAHAGEPISADDTQVLENVAGYVVRNPLCLQRLVYLDGQQAVIYKGLKHNPTLSRNFETMDPLEWLARIADHIPDPGKHRTHFYG